jgi:hypothetical protein
MDVGLFVEFPCHEGTSEHEAFAECFALVEEAEATNVASVWLSEYHFSAISVLSSPITVASAFAARTRRIRCAESGGSHGDRLRLWKRERQRLANPLGLDISVCHVPPGTRKWHTIAHRLFSSIGMHWRGQPLINHEVIVELIGATTTRSGLRVEAHWDTNRYPTQSKVTDAEMAALHMTPHDFHGEWNYTVKHRRS